MKIIITAALLLFLLITEKSEKTVLLDSYFNNETRENDKGKKESWHYKWEETDNNGYSLLGSLFRSYKVATKTSFERPSKAILGKADIYIIVDPDIPKENPDAKYIESQDITTISDWVKEGGVLVMMGNDTGNAEFDHFNKLAAEFGITFNKDSRNNVMGNQFETGALTIPSGNLIIRTARKIYMKDICTLHVTDPAKAVLTDKGDVIMAIAKIGRGTVFAVGDPWLYNEYTDGKKLPKQYQNYNAAQDLVRWLVKQLPPKKK